MVKKFTRNTKNQIVNITKNYFSAYYLLIIYFYTYVEKMKTKSSTPITNIQVLLLVYVSILYLYLFKKIHKLFYINKVLCFSTIK